MAKIQINLPASSAVADTVIRHEHNLIFTALRTIVNTLDVARLIQTDETDLVTVPTKDKVSESPVNTRLGDSEANK